MTAKEAESDRFITSWSISNWAANSSARVNRFGKIIIALLILAGVGFASMVRFGPVDTGRREATHEPTPAAPSAQALQIPVEGVRAADLVDSFAQPRGGGSRRHEAIDILAPRGTPVLAAAAGMIEKIFESRLGGHTIYVRSPDGQTVYYYAHLDRYAPGLAERQNVVAGERIGFVGASGDADPSVPHLHFEVHVLALGDGWWQGKAVDPYPLLVGERK